MSDRSQRQQDILATNYALGRDAERILQATGSLHAEREQQLIKDMLVWFNNNPWDERTALRFVSQLSENRLQQMTLESRARTGALARAKLFGNQTTASD